MWFLALGCPRSSSRSLSMRHRSGRLLEETFRVLRLRYHFLCFSKGVLFSEESGDQRARWVASKHRYADSPLAWYQSAKQALLGGGYLTSAACSNFFNVYGRQQYFSQLTNAMQRQVAFDGIQTNISMYDAGLWGLNDLNKPTFPLHWQKTPICQNFTASSPNVAEAQVQSPATDAYINPRQNILRRYFSQSTILHEALHNLTGFPDPALAEVLGTAIPSSGATDII